MMSDYKKIDSGSNVTEKILDGLFPIEVTRSERLLTIVEKRSYGSILGWVLVILFVVVFGYPLFEPLLHIGEMFYIILLSLAVLAVIGYAVAKIFQTPYKRMTVFDKNQNFYKILEVTLLKNDKTVGKLSDIKKVNVQVTEHENSDYHISYSYYAYLQLDDFLAYQNSNIVPLQEDSKFASGGQTTSLQIASAVASFLNLPAPEETGDVSQNNGSGFMDDLSILK